jgi:tetratricopeptide (TPR) repeat protein
VKAGANNKRINMETKINLFMFDTTSKVSIAAPVKGRGSGLAEALYQVLNASASAQDFARALVRVCELAYGRRDLETLDSASALLCNLPLAQARERGLYYQAIGAHRRGEDGPSITALEMLARGSSLADRALQSLASIRYKQGQFDEAARLNARIVAGSADSFTVAATMMQLSAISSARDNHARSLDELRAAWPAVREASRRHPHLFYAWHNEIAFELLRLGDVRRARAASSVALSSPISNGYQEWHETALEIAEAERARVVVVVGAQLPERKPKPKVIIRFLVAGSRARRKVIKPTTGRAPVIRSMVERVAAVAPIHAPPAFRNYRMN